MVELVHLQPVRAPEIFPSHFVDEDAVPEGMNRLPKVGAIHQFTGG
jgi:hypothetical protein